SILENFIPITASISNFQKTLPEKIIAGEDSNILFSIKVRLGETFLCSCTVLWLLSLNKWKCCSTGLAGSEERSYISRWPVRELL
ncbi:MAG: hypothetical protein AAF633_19530, partial [Chloroflexota bacterium]